MRSRSILWRRLDRPGHESARLEFDGSLWRLVGCAVFADEGRPCALDYAIACNAKWETVSGTVTGWLGDETIDVECVADARHSWKFNGTDRPEVDGCTDLDLNFSPSTNLLPIRRLGLEIGQAAEVRAAWLRFPSFKLEPLPQTYRRLTATTYRYESNGGKFVADLQVNDAGHVTLYPGFCEAEASA